LLALVKQYLEGLPSLFTSVSKEKVPNSDSWLDIHQALSKIVRVSEAVGEVGRLAFPEVQQSSF
jgi:hypothetical protein